MSRRKQYTSQFKAQVALEAIKNQQTVAQIASEYEVHPTQVNQWKKQVLEQLPQLFTNGRSKAAADAEPVNSRTISSNRSVKGGVGLA